MGRAVIGGLITSTLLTPFAVPDKPAAQGRYLSGLQRTSPEFSSGPRSLFPELFLDSATYMHLTGFGFSAGQPQPIHSALPFNATSRTEIMTVAVL